MAVKKNTTLQNEASQKPSDAAYALAARDAFATGADAVNRVGVMINAALLIATTSGVHPGAGRLLADLLKEAQNLSENLAGMLEDERDTAAMKGGQ